MPSSAKPVARAIRSSGVGAGPLQLKDDVYAVGVLDPHLVEFDEALTPHGTSYNSYLVVDEQITLIDCTRHSHYAELLSNIKAVIGDRPIDNFIISHCEPDHSSAFPQILKAYPEAHLYGTMFAQKILASYYPDAVGYEFTVVTEGATLSTGGLTFEFHPTPMLHWPDSLATYLPARTILFSMDAMGQHIGTGERLDQDVELDTLMEIAGNYYANIVMPFGMQVMAFLNKVAGLDVDMVAPSHGVVLTADNHLPEMIAAYTRWGEGKTNPHQATIVYGSMWGSTAAMAEELKEELEASKHHVAIFNLEHDHFSTAVGHLLESRYIYVGSSTRNNHWLPSIAGFVSFLCGLKAKNRVGQAFGSYGWSGEACDMIDDALTEAGFEMKESWKALFAPLKMDE